MANVWSGCCGIHRFIPGYCCSQCVYLTVNKSAGIAGARCVRVIYDDSGIWALRQGHPDLILRSFIA